VIFKFGACESQWVIRQLQAVNKQYGLRVVLCLFLTKQAVWIVGANNNGQTARKYTDFGMVFLKAEGLMSLVVRMLNLR